MSEAELEIEMSSVVEVLSVSELELVEVLSVSELVDELMESSVPPLHEMIVRLTKKIRNMCKIFFTFSSNIYCGKKLNAGNNFLI